MLSYDKPAHMTKPVQDRWDGISGEHTVLCILVNTVMAVHAHHLLRAVVPVGLWQVCTVDYAQERSDEGSFPSVACDEGKGDRPMVPQSAVHGSSAKQPATSGQDKPAGS